MTNGMPTKPLAELCEFRNGLWKGKKPPYVHVGIIRNTNFNADGTLNETDIAFHDVEAKQFKDRQLEFGDIILEKSGGGPKQPVGRVITFEKQKGKFSFSNFTSIIRVRDPSALDFRYLHRVLYWYYASGITEGMQRRSTGIRNLDFSAYKRLGIPVPSLPEQRRIVGILDEAFAGIATAKANTEKNLQNARALFESYLNAVFTRCGEDWIETTIGDVCTLKSGTTVKKSLEKATGDLPYVKVADMTFEGNENEITTSSRFLNETDTGKNAAFPPGTTIFPKRGGAILTNKKRLTAVPIFADLNIMGVIPSKVLLPTFLYFYFLKVDMRELGSGSSIPQINNYDIEPLAISFPKSMGEQRRFVSKLESLSAETQRLQSIFKRKLGTLDELKKSLLHQAFSGAL